MRILVVDDEELARGRLIRLLSAIPDTKVVGEAADGASALVQIEALRPDLVLLDVDMPGLDGLAVAERPEMPPIVFTTAHSKFAVDAFEADAYDFLLKPVSRERLLRAIDKVRARRASAPPPTAGSAPAWQLTIADGHETRLVDARTITRFYALDKYVAAQVDGAELLLRETLDELGDKLSSFGFMRVHRSELVRVTAVKSLVTTSSGVIARLSDKQEARVSRRCVCAPNRTRPRQLITAHRAIRTVRRDERASRRTGSADERGAIIVCVTKESSQVGRDKKDNAMVSRTAGAIHVKHAVEAITA